MKKYRAPNGEIVEESVLRSKYGDRFDALVQSGTFTPVEEAASQNLSAKKYKTPNGAIVDETVLRDKYGDKFESYVSQGAFVPEQVSEPVKKKEDTAKSGSLVGQLISNPQSEFQESDKPGFASTGAAILASTAGFGPSTRKINIDGNQIEISASQLPEGYEKNGKGLQKFIEDMSVKMLGSSKEASDDAKRELYSAHIFTGAQKKTDFSLPLAKDLDEASSIIGRPAVVDEQTLSEIKAAKKAFLDADRKEFESNPDNYWIDGKTGEKRITKPYKAPDTSKYDNLIDKIDADLVEESSYKSMSSVRTPDMRNDFDKIVKGGPINKIVNAQARTKPELLDENFYTGLAYLKRKDEGRADMIQSRIDDGKTLSSSIVAELTSKGAAIREAKNSKRLLSGDYGSGQEAVMKYADDEQKIADAAEKNFWKRDELVDQAAASAISEYHASRDRDAISRGLNLVFGEWQVTDKEIDQVPDSWYIANGLDPSRPEFKNAIKRLKEREGFLPFQNAIKKDGLTRELLKGSAGAITGVTNFFENIGTNPNERRLQSELEPVSNYHRQRTDYYNRNYGMLADAFNGFGQFATQYALMEAGAGFVRGVGLATGGVGKGSLFTNPASAEFTITREGTKIGDFLIDKSGVISQLMVPYVMSYDDYFKRGLQQTDNVGAARLYGATMASVEALSEQIFGNLEFGREVMKNLKKGVISMDKIASVFNKGLSDKAVQAELRATIKDGFKAAMKGVAGLSQEAFEEVPVAASNFVMDSLINPGSTDGRDMGGEMKDAFMAGLVSFSIPSLLGIGSQVRGMNTFANSTTAADALMVAAMNRNDVMDAIYNLGEDGVFSQEEVNQKVQTLNTAASVVRSMPSTYMDQSPMYEADRVKYMEAAVKEKQIADQVKDLDKDDPERIIAETQIQELKQQRADILMKSSPGQAAPGREQVKGSIDILAGEDATGAPAAVRNTRTAAPTVVQEKAPYIMSDDDELLEEIKKNPNVGEFEKDETLQYFIDKTGEAPAQAAGRFGADVANMLLERVPTETLNKNFKEAYKIWGPDNDDVIALSEELELRAIAEEQEPPKPAETTQPETADALIQKKQQMAAEIETEREAEILKRGKPDLKLSFLSSQEMIASKDPVAAKLKQDELKNKYKEVKKVMDCLWT